MQIAGMSLNFRPFLQSSTVFTTENRVQWDLDVWKDFDVSPPPPLFSIQVGISWTFAHGSFQPTTRTRI